MGIFKPLNQVKLTNVSIVRLKKGAKRFEIACYKNKVIEWRNGVEKDLDNVLQTHQVFLNVSKGELASKDDLLKCFNTTDVEACMLDVLAKGDLQVGEKERNLQLSNLSKDIATIVSEKCVNPETSRPYPATFIEKAMKDIQYSVSSYSSAKKQALQVIALLQAQNTIPIKRASMRLRIVTSSKDGKRLKEKIVGISTIEQEDWSEDWDLTCLCDPGQFRIINSLIQEETKGKGRVEVLSVGENTQGDETFE